MADKIAKRHRVAIICAFGLEGILLDLRAEGMYRATPFTN